MRTKNACRDIIVTAPVQINIRIHVNIYINITHIFGVFSKPKRRETSLKETEASGAVLINLKPQERKVGKAEEIMKNNHMEQKHTQKRK